MRHRPTASHLHPRFAVRSCRAAGAATLLIVGSSCASTPDAEPAGAVAAVEGEGASASNETAAAPAEDAHAAASTRYRLGDYVVYRYGGAFSKEPVTLTEEIVKQEGLLLEIEVKAERGSDAMTWVQVVTDTPENQKNEVIDALFEIKDGERVKLPNEKNADIYRLYAWTLPPDLHPTGQGGRVEENLELAGASFACAREIGTGKVQDQSVRYSFAICPDFLWTNGPASIISEAGLEIWKREVVEVGSRAAK